MKYAAHLRYDRLRSLSFSALTFALIVVAPSRLAARANPQAPAATQQQNAPQSSSSQEPPSYSITVTVPVVNVDAVVTDTDGNYISGLKKENFRILEDGAPQTITNFSTGDAPITVVLLVEYSKMGYGWYLYNARNWADAFLHQLRPTDWVALASFAMRSNIEVDFTHDPREIEQGLIAMNNPVFTESVVFDSLVDTIERLRDVKGKKAVLLLASGRDTFSKLTLNQAIEKLKESDVSVYAVGVGEQVELQTQMRTMGQANDLGYIQAQNQLRTFAELTGGRVWFPRFEGEIPGIMNDVAASLRQQYSLAYSPTNQSTDGKYRKIKIELLGTDGGPLVITNAKGKKVKFQIFARQGYVAPKNNVTRLELPPARQHSGMYGPGVQLAYGAR